MTGALFSADDFRRRALQQSGSPDEEAWRDHGDFLLNPDTVPYLETLKLRDAAVLVPVIDEWRRGAGDLHPAHGNAAQAFRSGVVSRRRHRSGG